MPILSPHATSKEMLAYWDRIYAGIGPFDGAFSTKVRLMAEKQLLDKYLPRPRGKKILKIDLWDEVKNSGFLTYPASRGAEVFAIDISSRLVQKARKIFQQKGFKFHFAVADMRYLPFADRFFDLVWSIGTIEHIADPTLVAAEIYRVLKPGGTAIVGCPNRHDPYGSSLAIWLGNKLGFLPYGDEMSYSYYELEELMKSVGLKIIERTSPYFMPWFIRYPDIFLHLKARPLDLLFRPIVYPFIFLNKIEWLKKHANHLACVGRK